MSHLLDEIIYFMKSYSVHEMDNFVKWMRHIILVYSQYILPTLLLNNVLFSE